ncbi:MAG: hypothetical protein AB1743_08175 [Actinomycetota bacterium]
MEERRYSLLPGQPIAKRALEILNKRYAKREINKNEYKQKKRELMGSFEKLSWLCRTGLDQAKGGRFLAGCQKERDLSRSFF